MNKEKLQFYFYFLNTIETEAIIERINKLNGLDRIKIIERKLDNCKLECTSAYAAYRFGMEVQKELDSLKKKIRK